MRKLASIQKVSQIEPIENYDRIELATILGWTIIVQKGDFKAGDLCIFIEADSMLPEDEKYEFLRKRCFSKKYNRYKIRPMKMAGVISQGIAFPLNYLPKKININKIKEGQDVTKDMDIIKYDPELFYYNQQMQHHTSKYSKLRIFFMKLGFFRPKRHKKQLFPSYLVKTDETRLQAIPNIIPQMENEQNYITEKLDGTSITISYNKKDFAVCSRNMRINRKSKTFFGGNAYFYIVDKYDLENKLSNYCKKNKCNLAIQGEIIGPRIQGNKYDLDEIDLYVYRIFDIDKQKYIPFNLAYMSDESIPTVVEICNLFGLKTVPIINEEFKSNINDFLKQSTRKSILNPNIWAEGIVWSTNRHKTGNNIYTKQSRLSFKVVNPEFALQYDVEIPEDNIEN